MFLKDYLYESNLTITELDKALIKIIDVVSLVTSVTMYN